MEVGEMGELEVGLEANAVDGNLRFLQAIEQMEESGAAGLLVGCVEFEVVIVVEQKSCGVGSAGFVKCGLEEIGAESAQQRIVDAKSVGGVVAWVDGFVDDIP